MTPQDGETPINSEAPVVDVTLLEYQRITRSLERYHGEAGPIYVEEQREMRRFDNWQAAEVLRDALDADKIVPGLVADRPMDLDPSDRSRLWKSCDCGDAQPHTLTFLIPHPRLHCCELLFHSPEAAIGELRRSLGNHWPNGDAVSPIYQTMVRGVRYWGYVIAESLFARWRRGYRWWRLAWWAVFLWLLWGHISAIITR